MKGVVNLIRGTCQQFEFQIPYTCDQLDAVRITFWQADSSGTEDYTLPLIKTKDDCKLDVAPNKIYVSLNSKETLAFDTKNKAYVQLKASLVDGFVFASQITPITVYPILDETDLS